MGVFTDAQIQELNQPLDPKTVKQRQQGGAMVDYIDGHHAISEANRIFGFDGWSCEIIDKTKVQEEEKASGRDNSVKWNVGYIGTVKVTAGGVVRMDMGAGNGIDKNLFQAHESAIKEMVTDALKRCLKYYGSTFGLALYDKERKNVRKKKEVMDAEMEMDDQRERLVKVRKLYADLDLDTKAKQAEATVKFKALAKKNGTDWVEEMESAVRELVG